MRVTTKGQVTIPKEIRDVLGIRPGTEVEFRLVGSEARLVNRERCDDGNAGRRAVRLLRRTGDLLRQRGQLSDLSTDEIMDMTRGPFDDVDAG